jgi:Uncharacterized vancomycin resistance protein
MQTISYRITFTAKIIIIELLISLAGLCAGITWNIYSVNKKWSNLIDPNVKVAGVNLGGKTMEQGINQLEEQIIAPKLKEKVTISAAGKVFILENSKVYMDNNVNAVINQAYSFGKNEGPFERAIALKYQPKDENYNLNLRIDDNYIKDAVKAISADINRSPKNASLYINNDGSMIVIPATSGLRVDEAKLEEELKGKLSEINNTSISIEAPVEEIKADISDDVISKVNANIVSYTTGFVNSAAGRTSNIELAAGFINGKLIMPGESFSFNDTVGERTRERGFKEAPVIVGFEVDSGLGGGICQVSSTLYNAILKTGISSTERIHHTLPSEYVPIGQDATVDWNNIDYKFTNTLEYPIYIQAYTENKQLFINVYSNNSLTSKSYTIDNTVYETIGNAQRIIDNPAMEEGNMVVTQNGYQGYKVRVVRNTWENNTVTNTEIISDDLYLPVPRVISRGVKTVNR